MAQVVTVIPLGLVGLVGLDSLDQGTSDDFLVLLSLAALLVKHVLPGRGTASLP